ncbi:MAG: hypothetical protein Q4F65_13680 [Propionibacteriaceae bacterium]|nr:hypothetical protein [Propionibacteriaceae bacterium]
MTTFTEAFEELAPELIAAAWDFLDRDPRVEVVWVYLTQEDRVTVVDPFFRIDGDVYDHFDAAQLLGCDTSYEAQREMQDRQSDAVQAFADSLESEEAPTRIIVRFRTADQDFHAEFFHGELQPGVAEEDYVTDLELMNRWFARLRETGNDSAAL